jgi:hypothetical protein
MLRALRLTGMRHGIKLMAIFLVVGYGFSLWRPSPAMADARVDKLKSIALSDIALNLRMMALESLKAEASTAALDALETIAKEADLPLRTAACAQLGRVHSTASKAKLKGLLENANLRSEVRVAAVACIAEHWRDTGDITYLDSKCAGNATLEAHLTVVKSRIYGLSCVAKLLPVS